MSESFIRIEKRERVAVLTMNRPESLNAIASIQDCTDFVTALDITQKDPDVGCVILTGAGTAFCAGGDLKAMKNRSGIGSLREPPDGTRLNYRRGVQRISEALWNCELPMIAAINGHALGLGLDLACLCDLRVAADSAKFAAKFVKLALVPGDGGAWILPRAIGLANAAEMFFTGDTFGAHDVATMGLISRAVPQSQLMDVAWRLAQRIVVNPVRALRLSKRLLREGQQQRLADLLELSAAFQALAHETADHEEAMDAFLDKRAPKFTGR